MVPKKDLLWFDRIIAIVKFSVFSFLFFAQTGLRASGAPRQNKPDARITIKLRNVLLRDALNRIGDVAHLSFVYVSNKDLDKAKVTLSAHREKIGVLLEKLLSPYSLRYTMVDNRIVVFRAVRAGHPLQTAAGKSAAGSGNSTMSY